MLILHYTNTVMIPQHTGNRIPRKTRHSIILVQVMVFHEKQEIYYRHPLTWTDIKPFFNQAVIMHTQTGIHLYTCMHPYTNPLRPARVN